jgi:lipid-binding SYLF domain-containing protein
MTQNRRPFGARRLLAAAVAALAIALPACTSTGSPTEQQDLVDRATLTVQEMMGAREGHDARPLLQKARGVLICPDLFKAGFVIGGQGGNCVLAGRGPQLWSFPAFYSLSAGSLGLQVGIQDSQLMLIVLSQRALQALIDNQFQFGGEAGLAFATLGTGVQGGSTAALQADVVAFARSRGLFAGLSLNGSVISVLSAWNAAYYGAPIAAQQLVVQGQGNNPGAAPLREILARYAGPG